MATLLLEPEGARAPVGAAPAARAPGADRPTPGVDYSRLAELAHDLKNPLALIDARAQLLERRLASSGSADAAAVRAGLAQIRAASARMDVLLRELVDAASSGGVPVLDRRPTDLVQLARQVAARHQGATERHTLRVESGAPSVVGLWDPSKLERVLTNLLSNAVKFSPDGGDVLVAIRPDRESVEVRVRDHGLGIPPGETERVFEPFHRAGNVVGVAGGTGLGLPGVRQIVEEHGGAVHVVSGAAGGGTEVLLRLPLSPPAA